MGVVAEWIVGAILADYKAFPAFRDAQVAGRWASQPARRLMGATVLIVGYGSIGEALEERLAPFGTEFGRVARQPRPGVVTSEALPELLGLADVAVLRRSPSRPTASSMPVSSPR